MLVGKELTRVEFLEETSSHKRKASPKKKLARANGLAYFSDEGEKILWRRQF